MSGADGLALGAGVRARRAALRRQIAAGDVDLAALLEGDLPTQEATALGDRMGALLGAVPELSGELVLKVAHAGGLHSLEARLRELTIAHRRAIANALRKEITPS
jgi:hypothetical protein